jgi:hypothetical protein
MRSFSIGSTLRFGALLVLAVFLAACGGGGAKPDKVQEANIPSSFDVTLLAEKDTQFDFEGAPLTVEDLKSAFRYRLEQKLPMGTVILKRGEKEKVKKEHILALARIAYDMKFNLYVLEKDGEISEIRSKAKE